MALEVNIIIAFIGGLLSFFSPCVLPLLPAFLAYLSGISVDELKNRQQVNRKPVLINTVLFVLGFSIIFSIVGVALNSFLISSAFVLNQWLSWIGGILIIIFGLFVLGIINIPFLQQEYKVHPEKRGNQYISSFIFGAAFAAGWTPCIGPILGTVLTLAITNPVTAFTLMVAYSLGLGIPFLVCGFFAPEALSFLSRNQKFLRYFNYIAGILLVGLGVLVFTGQLAQFGNLVLADPFINSGFTS